MRRNPYTSARYDSIVEQVGSSAGHRTVSWIDTSTSKKSHYVSGLVVANGWQVTFGQMRLSGSRRKNGFIYAESSFETKGRSRTWKQGWIYGLVHAGVFDPSTGAIEFFAGNEATGDLSMADYLRLREMLIRAATPGRLRQPEPRSNPTKPGIYRSGPYAVNLNRFSHAVIWRAPNRDRWNLHIHWSGYVSTGIEKVTLEIDHPTKRYQSGWMVVGDYQFKVTRDRLSSTDEAAMRDLGINGVLRVQDMLDAFLKTHEKHES